MADNQGNKEKGVTRGFKEVNKNDSSDFGEDSDAGKYGQEQEEEEEEEQEDNEVQSVALNSMSSMFSGLLMNRSISQSYDGRSESFSDLSSLCRSEYAKDSAKQYAWAGRVKPAEATYLKSSSGATFQTLHPVPLHGGVRMEEAAGTVQISGDEVAHKRCKGTVQIFYVEGDEYYAASDAKLTYEDFNREGNRIWRIFYEASPTAGLRLRIGRVGKKIFTCAWCTITLAGDHDIAHQLCTELTSIFTEDRSNHQALVQRLEAHSRSNKPGTETLFVVATPGPEIGFQISHVTPQGSYPLQKPYFSYGSGSEDAYKLLEQKLAISKPKSESEIVELLKEVVYYVSEEEKETVGGPITVTVSKVQSNCDTGKKELVTETSNFPPFKPLWPVKAMKDAIYIPKCTFQPVQDVSYESFNYEIIENIEKDQLPEDPWSVKGHVNTVRVYDDVLSTSSTFYQTTGYMERKEFKRHEVIMSYIEDQKEYKLSPKSDKDLSDANYQALIGRETNMFWDHDLDTFVICLA